MEVSLEYRALRRGASLLKDGVCPDDIVTPLYNNDLLTPDERSRANASHYTASQRMEEIYSALERRVKVERRAFHLLLDILKNVSALVPVAEKLREFWMTEHSVSTHAGRPGTYVPSYAYFIVLLLCITIAATSRKQKAYKQEVGFSQ